MEFHSKGPKIGEILLESGLVKQKELDEALDIQKKKGGLLGTLLVDQGFVKEEDLAFALAKQFHYPYLSLENVTVNKNLIKEFGVDLLLKYCFVPIEKTRDILTIAIADPSDEEMMSRIQKETHLKILAFVTGVKQIEDLVAKTFDLMKGDDKAKTDAILKKAADEKLKNQK